MTLQLFGLPFHLYGLIVGIAVAVGVHLAEHVARKEKISESVFWITVIVVVGGGILGARLYHVLTDWSLYQHHLLNIFKVWEGGLSIIGAFVGGVGGIGLSLLFIHHRQTPSPLKMLDISVLALPIAQVIGRWANYINQELYGWPTQLPWGIFIDPEHRVPGYQNYDRFHPLFAYEALGMTLFAGLLWWLYRKKVWQIGQGNYSLLYFGWYGVFRGSLESLRIEKALFFNTQLGLNQVILFVLGVGCMAVLAVRLLPVKRKMLLGLTLCVMAISFSGCQNAQNPSTNSEASSSEHKYQQLLKVKDHSKTSAQLKNSATSQVKNLTVEVVNTTSSVEKGLGGRQEIGSDGMLFVFPKKARYGFWMLNMKFDIDIIWISNGKVVRITPMTDPPGDSPGPSYYPPQPVEMVLEVPGGMTTNWQLQVGDSFELL